MEQISYTSVIMDVEFNHSDLRQLACDGAFVGGYQPGVVRKYRKIITEMQAVENRLSLYEWKALHFEKLKGDRKGQYSVKINDQYRIIFLISKNKDEKTETIVILEIGDYHK